MERTFEVRVDIRPIYSLPPENAIDAVYRSSEEALFHHISKLVERSLRDTVNLIGEAIYNDQKRLLDRLDQLNIPVTSIIRKD